MAARESNCNTARSVACRTTAVSPPLRTRRCHLETNRGAPIRVRSHSRRDNTERHPQALPGRITPLIAWQATPKAEPPRPQLLPSRKQADPPPPTPSPNGRVRDGMRIATIHPNGSIALGRRPAPRRRRIIPDGNHLAGIDSSERIWISSAGATIWEQVGIAHGAAHAITVTDSGALLIVADSGVTLLPAPSS